MKHKQMRGRRLGFAVSLGFCLLGAGCATYQQTSSEQLSAFMNGQANSAIAYYESDQTGKDAQLNLVEAGRLKLLEGDFAGSHYSFSKAITHIADLQEGAIIRLKDVGGTILTSTFLDDRNSPYNLPAFEMIFTFQQQALNSIFLGDLEGAGVELRRAVYAQDLVADEYEKQIEKAKNEATSQDTTKGMETVDQHYASMGPVLGRAKSGFQNPYVWYFSGLLYEVNKDPGNAYIAYKKAWEIMPDNPSLQHDLLRLSRTENPDEYPGFASKFQARDQKLDRLPAEIVVMYEEGLISQRYSEAIRIFVLDGFQSITFPVYRDGPFLPAQIRALWDGKNIGQLMPLCYAQTLAYHDLHERIPGIAIRNITRVITREITKEAGRQSNDPTIELLTSLGAGVASLADEADTRGWYTLPMAIQMLRVTVPPGARTLSLINGQTGRPLDIPVDLKAGETKLIWIADQGVRSSSAVASLTHPSAKNRAWFLKWINGMPFNTSVSAAPAANTASIPGIQ